MKFTKQTFENQNVLLDGNEFVGCTFTKCHMEFAGMVVCHLDSNRFNDCTWGFIGPAGLTLSFMAAMYGDGGDSARLIENTLAQIRTGKISPPKK